MQFNTEGKQLFLRINDGGDEYRFYREVAAYGTHWQVIGNFGRVVVDVPVEMSDKVDSLFEAGAMNDELTLMLIRLIERSTETSWEKGYNSGRESSEESMALGVADLLTPIFKGVYAAMRESK